MDWTQLDGGTEVTRSPCDHDVSRRFRRLAFALVLASLSGLVGANEGATFGQCPEHHMGQPPVLLNARLGLKTRGLCSRQFAVLHSGITRTPLFTLERLTRATVSSAQEQARYSSFHPDPRLPPDERAELRDYSRSGYDRGHLAPSGDMPDGDTQAESFALSNMIPQHPRNNRYLWSAIESTTRILAKRHGSLFVVTGTIYAGTDMRTIGNGVLVPTHLYKALLNPATGESAAYVVSNDESKRYAAVDLKTLETLSGVRVFPVRRPGARDLELPAPLVRGSREEIYERVSYGMLFQVVPKDIGAMVPSGGSRTNPSVATRPKFSE